MAYGNDSIKDPLDTVFAFTCVLLLVYVVLSVSGYFFITTLIYGSIIAALYFFLNSKRPAGPTGFGLRHTALDVSEGVDLKGQVAIVTGPSSGIGIETAAALAFRGAHVVMAARDEAKTQQVIKALETRLAQKGVKAAFTFIALDLSSFESVRAFVKEFTAKFGNKLNILICNAGIMALQQRKTTKDGFEAQVGTCHLGHFLLVNLLLPALKASAPSRVVVVSSAAHRFAAPKFLENNETLDTVPYHHWTAYGNAKGSNVLFATELNNRYSNEGVTAYTLHPGGIHTGLQDEVELYIKLKWLIVTPFFFKSLEQGAATSVFCATHKLAKPGAYHDNSNPAKLQGPCAEWVENKDLLKKFWETSERLTGLAK